jgi:hypothetical protein
MKNIFSAVAKQISSTQKFPFEEGSRHAVVEEKRFLFGRISVSCEFSDDRKGFLGSYARTNNVSKEDVEAAKQAAQNFCQTGRIAKPQW